MKKPVLVGAGKLPFSPAIQVGRFIFVSGQASVDLGTGEIIKGTFSEEMARSINNLRDVLEEGGARWEDIVKVSCYVRRETDLAEYNRLYAEAFSAPYPARTTITNCLPSTLLFEIDCIACMPDASEAS